MRTQDQYRCQKIREIMYQSQILLKPQKLAKFFIFFSLKNANGRRKSTFQNDFCPSLIFVLFKLFFDLILPTEMILVMKCGLGGKI